MGFYDDSFIDDYKKLTAMAHSYNANIILQLAAMGSQTTLKEGSEKVLWGASAVQDLAFKGTPKEMTVEEILELQGSFAAAALRAKQAGFDAVQMHVAHGYLLNKFLSPYYNRRTDNYGGSIENRARIVLETYKAIREKVGADYPVLAKINSEDFMDDGMTFADCEYVCKQLAALGVDAIEISGGRPLFTAQRRLCPENSARAGILLPEIRVPDRAGNQYSGHPGRRQPRYRRAHRHLEPD